MPYRMDVGDYFARTSGLGSDEDPMAMKEIPTAGLLSGARNYGKSFGKGFDLGGDQFGAVMDSTGTQSILGGRGAMQEMEYGLGGSALRAIARRKAAEEMADAQRSSADKQASANRSGAIIGAVGGIAAAGIGALI